MKARLTPAPSHIDWQLTYACQLRCVHCYTESGRRASRKLPREDLLRIAEILVDLRVKRVLLCGGEPLLVPEVFEIVERLTRAGIGISFYTNGIDLTREQAVELAERDAEIHVSIDGATPEVNDPIRGRAGAFAAIVASLEMLDELAAERDRQGLRRLRFGIDVTLIRSNFDQIRPICATLAPRFRRLAFIQLGAVIPSGLAAEEAFARHEVLTQDQLDALGSPELEAELRALAPPSLDYLCVNHNLSLQLHSERARGMPMPYEEVMEIEPDGAVRAMVTYEGVVGNLLRDPPELLWRRCQERVHDPAVIAELSAVTTPEGWAAAVRRLDEHFGTAADRRRYARRRPYAPPDPLVPISTLSSRAGGVVDGER